jgi:hypothetical protein
MPMHPRAQPNFRNLFWYPFKITLITALRTFPFFGKRWGAKMGAYHNTEHPEFLDEATKNRMARNAHINDISKQQFAPDRVTTDLTPTLWKPQQFSIRMKGSKKSSLGYSSLVITMAESVLFGKHVLLVSYVFQHVLTIVFT